MKNFIKTEHQRGFTLIELMIGMVVSTILLYFILSTQSRMTRAFRVQNTVSDVTSTLRGAQGILIRELQMAGYGLTDGRIGISRTISGYPIDPADPLNSHITFWGGLWVNNTNDNVTPDEFGVIYGDGTEVHRVWAMSPQTISINDAGIVNPHTFAIGDIMLVRSRGNSCLMEITNIDVGTGDMSFTNSGVAFNTDINDHCDPVRADASSGVYIEIMRAVMNRYRIDITTVPGQGILQRSTVAYNPVASDWVDLAYGFTNLQIAFEYLTDPAGAATRTWFSSNQMNTRWWDFDSTEAGFGVPVRVSLSLEAKSPFGTRGTPTLGTPAYGMFGIEGSDLGDWGQDCPSNPTYNPCGVDIANTPDASRPARYRGENIYRYSITKVDMRNMGLPLPTP